MTVQELRDLLTAAAPGPWYLCGREGSRWIGCDPHDSPFERSAGEKVWAALSVGNFAEPDAALLVAAVNALPALLDVAEATERHHRSHHCDWRARSAANLENAPPCPICDALERLGDA